MLSSGRVWAGIDAGKGYHHVVAVDGEGRRLLSRRVVNDEAELTGLVDVVLQLAGTVTWAIDLADGAAALVITLLLDRGQRVLYLPGIAVNRAAAAYRGEGKTDLLTELRAGVGWVSGRERFRVASVGHRDLGGRWAAGLVRAGGAAGRVGWGDGGSV